MAHHAATPTRPLAGLAAALLCAVAGAVRYAPALTTWREVLFFGALAGSGALAWHFRPHARWRQPQHPAVALTRTAAFTAALAAGVVTIAVEAQFTALRQRVLAAPPQDLARVGRHVMAGFDDLREIRRLVEARAIAGVHLGARNVQRHTAADVAAMIEDLQELRAAVGDPPLWVAADQEGGSVQPLSPPLPRQPALGRVMSLSDSPIMQESAVRGYAIDQGRALAAIGVNVNFAPVVDLDYGTKSSRGGYRRLARRAISSHAATVAQAATWYCDGLRAVQVRCARKHFPGLGRLTADARDHPATLATPITDLAARDWLPFATAEEDHGEWIMLGHARLADVDPIRPASASPAVIALARDEIGHTSVLVTDDLTHRAIRSSDLDVSGTAVEALAAGADMLLVSVDPDHVYVVLDALLRAQSEGRFDPNKLAASRARLAASARLFLDKPAIAPSAEAAPEANTMSVR